jgi:hypothetical protein
MIHPVEIMNGQYFQILEIQPSGGTSKKGIVEVLDLSVALVLLSSQRSWPLSVGHPSDS